MSTVPLWRNRDFVLLETGRLLSSTGSASTSIAYPLLVLAVTHSPAKAGLVSFARLLPAALFGLFSGIAADRWNRKRIMIVADAVRTVAISGLVVTVVLDPHAFWPIPIVAFVEGTGSTFFSTDITSGMFPNGSITRTSRMVAETISTASPGRGAPA